MANDWAKEFRKRIEEREDRYEAAGGLDDSGDDEEGCDDSEDVFKEDNLDPSEMDCTPMIGQMELGGSGWVMHHSSV